MFCESKRRNVGSNVKIGCDCESGPAVCPTWESRLTCENIAELTGFGIRIAPQLELSRLRKLKTSNSNVIEWPRIAGSDCRSATFVMSTHGLRQLLRVMMLPRWRRRQP